MEILENESQSQKAMMARIVRNSLMVCKDFTEQLLQDVEDVIMGTKVAVEPMVANFPPMEPPIKPQDAAKLLGVGVKDLEYHARCGRIRVVKPEGSRRAFGYVAEDIRKMLAGTTRNKAA